MRFMIFLFVVYLINITAWAQPSEHQLIMDKANVSAKIDAGDYGAVSSLWIEQHGEVLFYQHFRGTDKSTHHNMRSVGKTVTGMLLGAAIDDGFISDINQKVAQFFPELQPFENVDIRKDNIELEHLLSMSGPLECDDFNNFSRGNEERMYIVEDWSKFFWDLPLKNRPSWEIPEDNGEHERLFSYCTAGAQLIGEVVERVAGRSAPDYAKTRLFDAIGITKPKWNFAATGKAHLGGGLELTTTDWAKIGRLLVNYGDHQGTQILSRSWIESSFSNYTQTEPGTGYGYFLWRPEYKLGGKTYVANMMSGTGGNRIYILPEHGVVAVITKNNFRDRQGHNTSDDLFLKEIVARLTK